MIIRPATGADWDSIWPFFEAIVAAGDSYAFPLGLTSDTARPWWMESPPAQTVVAEQDGVIVGSAKMGPNRPGRGSHVATASFMVDPFTRSRGVGRALGEYMVEWARTAGYHGIQFNAVVESNVAAVRLWQVLGFEIVGTVPDAYDHATLGLVGLHVMYLPLTDSTAAQ
jgi:GNAT superfamily N-acetyltransferase